jgi:hypothetical protein
MKRVRYGFGCLPASDYDLGLSVLDMHLIASRFLFEHRDATGALPRPGLVTALHLSARHVFDPITSLCELCRTMPFQHTLVECLEGIFLAEPIMEIIRIGAAMPPFYLGAAAFFISAVPVYGPSIEPPVLQLRSYTSRKVESVAVPSKGWMSLNDRVAFVNRCTSVGVAIALRRCVKRETSPDPQPPPCPIWEPPWFVTPTPSAASSSMPSTASLMLLERD